MEFVAFDFETANETRRSACAVGVAWVEDGRVARSRSFLIRPPELRFAPINISIHGIKPADVASEPEFPDRWPALRKALAGKTVLAHNAAFDFSVLRALLDHYGLEYPELQYLCTWKMAKAAWPELGNHRLDTVASALDIRFSHHQAESDAIACAEIGLRIQRATGRTKIDEAAEAVGVLPGRLYRGGYCPCGATAPRR